VSVRPGVTITQRSTPSPRANPADTGVWSVVGITDAGPLAPSNSPAFTTLIQSMADFERLYGLRSTVNSLLYDELDLFFREGGSRAWVSRVVGPAAAVATKNLLDVGAGISLVATSIGPGSFYNTVKIGVRAGDGVRLCDLHPGRQQRRSRDEPRSRDAERSDPLVAVVQLRTTHAWGYGPQPESRGSGRAGRRKP
jgi:hypothetical protein